MLIIGITGGIGSGKSTVTQFLQGKGYPIIDADAVARDVVAPGTEVLEDLVARFGKGILHIDGTLNRSELAALVFGDMEQKKALDQITHGKIIETIGTWIEERKKKNDALYAFVDAALLVETGLHQMVDQIWLVTASHDQRIQRVASRDETEPKFVEQRIDAQSTDEEKRKYADYILENSGSKEALYQQIEEILRENENI